jgi:hypothetical protein
MMTVFWLGIYTLFCNAGEKVNGCGGGIVIIHIVFMVYSILGKQ